MFIFKLDKNISTLYKDVPNFPMGIKDAFDELYDKFEGRDYYGISHMDADCRIIYKAAAAELTPGEGEKNGYKTFTISKGEYLAEPITDWMSKMDNIKEVFGQLMADPRFDNTHDCVEWYKSDEEMLCLVKCK